MSSDAHSSASARVRFTTPPFEAWYEAFGNSPREVHDRAPTPSLHVARGDARAEERRHQVQVEDLAPLVHAEFQRRLPHRGAGVVDQHVDAAEVGRDALERALDLLLVGDVADHAQRLGLGAGVEVQHRDLRARLEEQFHRRRADTAAAAGDDGDLAVQFEDLHAPSIGAPQGIPIFTPPSAFLPAR
jgi:hypothetical protein